MVRWRPTGAQMSCALGFAAYWSWIFSTLLTNAFGTGISAPFPVDTWLISTALHLATLALLGAKAHAWAPYQARYAMFIVAPSACVTGLALLVSANPPSPDAGVFVALGAMFGGVGTGCLVVLWAEVFLACTPDERKQPLLFVGIILGTVFGIVLSLLPSVLFVAALGVLPVAAAIALHSPGAVERPSGPALAPEDAKPPRSPGFIAYCLVFPIPLGLFQTWFNADLGSVTAWAPIMGPSLAVLVAVFAADAALSKRLHVNVASTLIMPVMVAGLFVLAAFGDSTFFVAGVLVYVAQQVMSVVLYARFGIMAGKASILPARAYALGIICTDIGFIVGMGCGRVLRVSMFENSAAIALGISYLLVVVAFLALGARPWDKGGEPSKLAQNAGGVLDAAAEQHGLTPRERDMLGYLLRGKSVPAIASEAYLSANTVRTHIAHIYQKFDVHSRDELVSLLERQDEGAKTL